jgi:molybdopterin molybdotransferase
LEQAVGRVLGTSTTAAAPLPHFRRSTMDGYAVRAADTFGASLSAPALLKLVGAVRIGRPPEVRPQPGQAVDMPTGGMMPDEADAVVMLEYAERVGEDMLQVFRPVAPGQHVQQVGEDLAAGDLAVPEGSRLSSAQVALLAALGHMGVSVRRRPRVAIISTGDEIVPSAAEPGPAQTRDCNAYGLAALCQQSGAEPVLLGIVPDELQALTDLARAALQDCQVLLISGGSSLGARDLTLAALEQLGPPGVFANGLSLRPGKPTIIAQCGPRLVFGLPGHPSSALVVAHRLVRPVLHWLTGGQPRDQLRAARLSRNVASEPGFEQYLRVRTTLADGEWVAEPLFGKSASIASLAAADGLVRIAAGDEGLVAGSLVQVILWD